MDWKQVKALTYVNVLYASPETTQAYRKQVAKKIAKGQPLKESDNAAKSSVNSFVLLGLIMMVIFGIIVFFIDLPRNPARFTLWCTIFLLMGLGQIFQTIFNVFYDSNDWRHFQPLPFENNSIFAAKTISVAMTGAPFLLPFLPLFMITSIKAGVFLPVAILLPLLLFALFLPLFLIFCIWIMSSLAQTSLFTRYRKVFTAILLGVPVILAAGGSILMMTSTNPLNSAADKFFIPVFYPYFKLMTAPTSIEGLLGLAGTAVLLLLFIFLLRVQTIPKMFRQLLSENSQSRKIEKAATVKKATEYAPLSKQLSTYNIGLIKNPTVWVQNLSTALTLPAMFLIGLLLNEGMRTILSKISPVYFVVFVIAGFAIATVSISSNSIVSLIISLDRDNFTYIRSLPLSMKAYLKIKFRLAFVLQLATNLILLVGVSIAAQLQPFTIFAIFLGMLLGTYRACIQFFSRDYRHLNLSWGNLSDLINRSKGQFVLILSMIVPLVLGGGAIAGTAVLLNYFPAFTWAINGVEIAVILVGVFLTYLYYRKRFWEAV